MMCDTAAAPAPASVPSSACGAGAGDAAPTPSSTNEAEGMAAEAVLESILGPLSTAVQELCRLLAPPLLASLLAHMQITRKSGTRWVWAGTERRFGEER